MGGGSNSWFNAGVNETADQLILDRELQPFIIVGTSTTSSDTHANRIYNELIPFIDQKYNTNSNRRFRAVAGGSLGGSASYRLAFVHPEMFSSTGIFGAGVVNGEDEQVKTWLAAMTDENRVRVFLNTGEEDPLMLKQAKVLTIYLDEANISYEFIIDEYGDHSYGYWAQSFETYFLWVAKNW
jgi:enterochelin esterase-like enzyme